MCATRYDARHSSPGSIRPAPVKPAHKRLEHLLQRSKAGQVPFGLFFYPGRQRSDRAIVGSAPLRDGTPSPLAFLFNIKSHLVITGI
jgi:hypothetical protein